MGNLANLGTWGIDELPEMPIEADVSSLPLEQTLKIIERYDQILSQCEEEIDTDDILEINSIPQSRLEQPK